MGMKPSDAFCWSACASCHRSQHEVGEATFQKRRGINLMQLAKEFYYTSPHKAKLDDPWKDGE